MSEEVTGNTQLVHYYRGFWIEYTTEFAMDLAATHGVTPAELIGRLIDEKVDHGFDTIMIRCEKDMTFYARVFCHENWQASFEIFKIRVRETDVDDPVKPTGSMTYTEVHY